MKKERARKRGENKGKKARDKKKGQIHIYNNDKKRSDADRSIPLL